MTLNSILKYGPRVFLLYQDAVDREVEMLLSLKTQYKTLTGEDLTAKGRKDKKASKEHKEGKMEATKADKQQKQEKQQKQQAVDSSRDVKKQTRCVQNNQQNGITSINSMTQIIMT